MQMTATATALGILVQGRGGICASACQQLLWQQRQFHSTTNSSSNTTTTSSSSAGSDDTLHTLSSMLSADTTAAAAAAAAAASGMPPDVGFFAAGAAALDALHAATGLPWCVVIPAAAVTIKTVLLPLSLKQAQVVRTNMVLWKEAYEFQQQQHARMQRLQLEEQQQQQQRKGPLQQHDQQQQHGGPMQQHAQQKQQQILQQQAPLLPAQQQQQQQQPAGSPGPLDAAAAALQQLQHWHERLQLFHDLRRKCGVPHPAWLLVNSSLQVPIFIYTAASIRRMAQASWPGFSTEGALWFSDLTQPALLWTAAGLELPMGLPGLILPLTATAVMLTSIHLGFKASGAAAKHPSVSGTWLAAALVWLRPALYALTLASAVVKVQLPQAPVLHWATTASYTLGLQLGLRSPRVRELLGISQPGKVDSRQGVDPGVVAQAAAMDNADVLVVMGAKHAALQRYNEAMHCLDRALQLNPHNARAHYSAGQIFAMQFKWGESEQSYRACAAASQDAATKAQALYCVGVACAQQGTLEAAVEAYEAAQAAGPAEHLRPMIALGVARALQQAGKGAEAAAVAGEALRAEWAGLCVGPVAEALQQLAGGAGAAAPTGAGSAEGKQPGRA